MPTSTRAAHLPGSTVCLPVIRSIWALCRAWAAAYPTGTVRTTLEPAALQEPDGVYQLADGRLVLSHACR